MKIGEVLGITPPRLMLDHNWKVFDLIAQLENREYFNVEDVKSYLSNELREMDNPIVKRQYFRALICLEALLNELVGSGLLVKEKGAFRKTNIFLQSIPNTEVWNKE